MDLMPRLSLTPTVNATTESELTPLVSETVGGFLSPVTLDAVESLHAKAAAIAIAAASPVTSRDA